MGISKAGISGRSREQLSRLTARGRHLVTVNDAVARLQIGRTEAAKMMARWAEQGWLRRVRRGLYIAVPVDAEHPDLWTADPLVVATAVWSPCYFTGWTAGNHWGLTDQIFQTVVVKTTRRVRTPHETLLNYNYLVANVAAARLRWGMRVEWISDTKVRFADEARVVVDVLDDPGIGGGIRHCSDMLGSYMAEYDRARLIACADRLGNAAVFKRLGYLCEVLRLADEAFLNECEKRLTPGTAVLDPSARKGGDRNARWRIQVNAHIEDQAAS
jgi:predicted transcriptional regulator of viral defense system